VVLPALLLSLTPTAAAAAAARPPLRTRRRRDRLRRLLSHQATTRLSPATPPHHNTHSGGNWGTARTQPPVARKTKNAAKKDHGATSLTHLTRPSIAIARSSHRRRPWYIKSSTNSSVSPLGSTTAPCLRHLSVVASASVHLQLSAAGSPYTPAANYSIPAAAFAPT
jgi:hypothetical protein